MNFWNQVIYLKEWGALVQKPVVVLLGKNKNIYCSRIHKFMVLMNTSQAPQGLIAAVWFLASFLNTATNKNFNEVLCVCAKLQTNKTVHKNTF